ncbi:MAG: hypothetical protein BGO38_05270 [Cellulomonas sp. 73-145]|uniref:TetR/AcrR family transcriptional regulator n=1 Tax=Cellulomonas sp. 73-145 TaxID=1895739 RepID=UPI00092AFF5A|nr:TetR/AcrR family transcriptional regulator [Cellulomonas sp. 73-145]MBN9326823.1 TetR/AcrR family transcriptional regulator [Cellulomonas sp.]OJV57545.1 MAG: hypothetical protein BGO38_05270 [Cellulomonas sp. 73-145]
MQVDDDAAVQAPRRPGRRRDDSRDDAILEATRHLLAERGYEGTTMDAVAERACAGKATVYRRWPSKVQLVVDSLLCDASSITTIDDVPDTGSLRGDLLSVSTVRRRTDSDDVMAGLIHAVAAEPEVAAVFKEQFVRARVALMRGLLVRAQERGEVPEGLDLDMVAAVAPAMISYHKTVEGKHPDQEFLVRVVDSVILPLVTGRAAGIQATTSVDTH